MDNNMFIDNLEAETEKMAARIERIREKRKAELCKTCIKTDVCMNDKNLFGDVYVAPNPWFFDEEYRKKTWENYKKREAEGFPCEHYVLDRAKTGISYSDRTDYKGDISYTNHTTPYGKMDEVEE